MSTCSWLFNDWSIIRLQEGDVGGELKIGGSDYVRFLDITIVCVCFFPPSFFYNILKIQDTREERCLISVWNVKPNCRRIYFLKKETRIKYPFLLDSFSSQCNSNGFWFKYYSWCILRLRGSRLLTVSYLFSWLYSSRLFNVFSIIDGNKKR